MRLTEFYEPSTANWMRLALRDAYQLAQENSPDPSTKVGALILREEDEGYRQIGRATNRINHQVDQTSESKEHLLVDRAWKGGNILHAEPLAIKTTRTYGFSPEGQVMVMPWIPCEACAEEIVDAGLAELVSHEAMILRSPTDWEESLVRGLETLQAGGVRLRMYSGEIGEATHLFRGQTWQP